MRNVVVILNAMMCGKRIAEEGEARKVEWDQEQK